MTRQEAFEYMEAWKGDFNWVHRSELEFEVELPNFKKNTKKDSKTKKFKKNAPSGFQRKSLWQQNQIVRGKSTKSKTKEWRTAVAVEPPKWASCWDHLPPSISYQYR